MQDERNTKKMLVIVSNRKCYRGHSIITSLLGGRWVYTFFVILGDAKAEADILEIVYESQTPVLDGME